MKSGSIDKWLGYLGLALLLGSALVASTDYESSSSTRRGQGAESIWYGVQVVVGAESPVDGGLVWPARLLALAGVLVIATWIWLRSQRRSAPASHPPVR